MSPRAVPTRPLIRAVILANLLSQKAEQSGWHWWFTPRGWPSVKTWARHTSECSILWVGNALLHSTHASVLKPLASLQMTQVAGCWRPAVAVRADLHGPLGSVPGRCSWETTAVRMETLGWAESWALESAAEPSNMGFHQPSEQFRSPWCFGATT